VAGLDHPGRPFFVSVPDVGADRVVIYRFDAAKEA